MTTSFFDLIPGFSSIGLDIADLLLFLAFLMVVYVMVEIVMAKAKQAVVPYEDRLAAQGIVLRDPNRPEVKPEETEKKPKEPPKLPAETDVAGTLEQPKFLAVGVGETCPGCGQKVENLGHPILLHLSDKYGKPKP